MIFPEPGEYTLTATLRDSNGKTASQSITIIFKAALSVTAPDSIHIGTKFPVGISGAGSLPVSWGVKMGSKPVTLDSNTGFLSNDGGILAMFSEGTYTITATVRDDAGNLTSAFANITVTNTAPVIESFTANTTRNMKDGRFYADLSAVASDPDGDAVHLEWSSEYQQDGYYEVGTHTIRVRAVDAYGAASPWSAIVFFVADDVGGGMTLTSANSFIEETGISFEDDGETIYGYITEYTFDVPPVSGHSGSDYGKVEAYNILTGQWDEIAYKTTNNGVTLSGQLPTGTYTQMRFYYYTNHDCIHGSVSKPESPSRQAVCEAACKTGAGRSEY